MLQARDPAALLPHVRRHHPLAVVDRDHPRAEAHVEAVAHVAVRDGVQDIARPQVAVRLHLGRRPGHLLPRLLRQRSQRRALPLLERHERALPRRPMGAQARCRQAPLDRRRPHALQGVEVAPAEETRAGVGHTALDFRLVGGVCRPRRVDKEPVVPR